MNVFLLRCIFKIINLKSNETKFFIINPVKINILNFIHKK